MKEQKILEQDEKLLLRKISFKQKYDKLSQTFVCAF